MASQDCVVTSEHRLKRVLTTTFGPRGDVQPYVALGLGLLRIQMSASLQAAVTHPRESRLIQRAYQAPPRLQRKLERHDAQVRIQHMLGLVREAQAKGELAADLDPEVVAHVLAAILGGLGPLVMQRLGLDPARDAAVPAERLDPAVLEPVFDDIMRLMAHGLHGQ